jgi:uncharacterized protein YxeA
MIKIKKILIVVIALILLCFPGQINAQDQSDLTYQELLERNQELIKIASDYKEMWEESENQLDKADKLYTEEKSEKEKFKRLYEKEREDKKEYRQLYLSSEEDLKKTLKSNERLHDYIDSLNETIDEHLGKSNISVSTGVGINAKNPEESLFIVQLEFGI